jgi:hypothetical protein
MDNNNAIPKVGDIIRVIYCEDDNCHAGELLIVHTITSENKVYANCDCFDGADSFVEVFEWEVLFTV